MRSLYFSYMWGSLRLAQIIITSECKALWGKPEEMPFFRSAHTGMLRMCFCTRDAVHVHTRPVYIIGLARCAVI